MSAPGGGPVSYVDVAASAAGVGEKLAAAMRPQMQQVGEQMARALGEGLQSALGGVLGSVVKGAFGNFFGTGELLNAFRAQGKLHSLAYVQEFEAATKAMGGQMLSGWKGFLQDTEPVAAEAGKLAGLAYKAALAVAVVDAAKIMVDDFKIGINLLNQEVATVGKFGKDAGEALMAGFKSVVEGEMPDVTRAFSVVEEGVHTSIQLPLMGLNATIDATVGHIPILGGAFKAAAGEAETAIGGIFAAIDEYKTIAGEYFSVLTEIGDKWQETARTIAGQIIDTENLEKYLDVVKEIAASGALVHFKDVGEVVGELNQRLSGLGEGAGLSRQQLAELATTVGEANELLGDIKINVDLLSAAFNTFEVAPEKVNEELTTLVNISRDTGANINQMLSDIDAAGPSLQNLGYDLDTTAFMLGKFNQEMGNPAMARLAFALAQLEPRLTKAGFTDAKEGLHEVVTEAEALEKVDHAAAVKYLQQYVGSARAAQTILEGIKKGIFDATDLQRQMAEQGEALHQPLDRALEASKSLQQTMEQLSNQVLAALEPLGVGLIEKLNESTGGLTDWLSKNQAKVEEWVGAVGSKLIEWGARITNFFADVLSKTAPLIESLKDLTVEAFKVMDLAVGQFTGYFVNIPRQLDPTGFVGAMQDMHTAANQALQQGGVLDQLQHLDIKGPMDAGSDALHRLGSNIAGLEGPWSDLIQKGANMDVIENAFKSTFAKEGGAAEYQLNLALDPESQVLKLLDPNDKDGIISRLQQLGIKADIDPDGKIKGFTANTEAQLDELERYLNSVLGPEAFAKLGGKVTFDLSKDRPNQLTPGDVMSGIGIPSELQGPDGIKIKSEIEPPAGGFPSGAAAPPNLKLPSPAPSGGIGSDPNQDRWMPDWMRKTWHWIERGEQPQHQLFVPSPQHLLSGPLGALGLAGYTQQIPGQVALQPAPFNAAPADILASAGIPAASRNPIGDGVQLAAELNLGDPGAMTPEDLMSKAGVGEKYQGDVTFASPGVVLPTELQTSQGQQKSISDLMDAAGIPSQNQGPDGVTLDMSFGLAPGMSGSVGGMGGFGMPGAGAVGMNFPSPGAGANAWRPAVQAALMRYGGAVGIPPQAYSAWEDAIIRQIGTESGGDPNAINLWDSNAQAGHPSQGLLQFIPSTYASHNISGRPFPDPYGQIAAVLSYAPRDAAGFPMRGTSGSIGEGHGYQTGGDVGYLHGPQPGPNYAQMLGGPEGWRHLVESALFQHGGSGAGASLHYHSPGHLLPHVGLPESGTSVWKNWSGKQTGGSIPWLPGTRWGQDGIFAMLAPNEHVVTSDEVDAAGGHGVMYAMRAAMRSMGKKFSRLFHFQGGGYGSASYAASGRGDDLQGVIPEIMGSDVIARQFGLTLTAGRSGHGTHSIDGGYHDSGEAGDFSNGVGTPQEAAFAQYMASSFGPLIAELIHYGPGWNANFNIKDGKFIRDYGGVPRVYDMGTLEGHQDHVHVAFRPGSVEALEQLSMGLGGGGGGLGGGGGMFTNAGFGGGGGGGGFGGIQLTDWTGPGGGGGGGGGGAVPTPGTPGTGARAPMPDFGPPPGGMPQAAAGTPGAISTPYGTFQYTWALPPEEASKYNEKVRGRFDEWLNKYDKLDQQADSDAGAVSKAMEREATERDKMTEKRDAYHALLDPILATGKTEAEALAMHNTQLNTAYQQYADALRSLQDATDGVTAATKRQGENITQQNLQIEKGPPGGWGGKGDQNAQELGKGLVSGIAQELGFPDIFGKAPWQWGSAKLGMGILGQILGGAFGGMGMPGMGGGGMGGMFGNMFGGGGYGGGQVPATGAVPGAGALPPPDMPGGGYSRIPPGATGDWTHYQGAFYPPGVTPPGAPAPGAPSNPPEQPGGPAAPTPNIPNWPAGATWGKQVPGGVQPMGPSGNPIGPPIDVTGKAIGAAPMPPGGPPAAPAPPARGGPLGGVIPGQPAPPVSPPKDWKSMMPSAYQQGAAGGGIRSYQAGGMQGPGSWLPESQGPAPTGGAGGIDLGSFMNQMLEISRPGPGSPEGGLMGGMSWMFHPGLMDRLQKSGQLGPGIGAESLHAMTGAGAKGGGPKGGGVKMQQGGVTQSDASMWPIPQLGRLFKGWGASNIDPNTAWLRSKVSDYFGGKGLLHPDWKKLWHPYQAAAGIGGHVLTKLLEHDVIIPGWPGTSLLSKLLDVEPAAIGLAAYQIGKEQDRWVAAHSSPDVLTDGKFDVNKAAKKMQREGIRAHAAGSLPDSALIQPATDGLVQWAEPSTGGEAFIPLAGGQRSRDIWALTGRKLGVYQDGAVTSPALSYGRPGSPSAMASQMGAAVPQRAPDPDISAMRQGGGGTTIVNNMSGVMGAREIDATVNASLISASRQTATVGGSPHYALG